MGTMGIAIDAVDDRDHIYDPPAHGTPLPTRHDLRPDGWQTRPLWRPWYQGRLQNCTAMVLAAYDWYLQHKDGMPDAFEPSRNYLWYHEKVLEHRRGNKAGSMRDGVKILDKLGVCPKEMWPTNRSTMGARNVDVAKAEEFGRNHRSISYKSVPRVVDTIKACLLSNHPVTVGVKMHFSANDTKTIQSGDIPVPGTPDPFKLNHALLIVGYDDAHPTYRGITHTPHGKGAFFVRNSMGNHWGTSSGGYGSLPYEFVTDPRDLSHSLWMIQGVK